MAVREPASFWWETVMAVVILLGVLGPLHMHPDIFVSTTFSFRIQKFPRPHVSGVKSDLPVHTSPTRIRFHSSTQDSAGKNWQQSMRRKAREICILLCLERTWQRGCYLENSIHGKELGLILLRHRMKKHPDLTSVKTFLSGERIQKCPDTCGRGLS